MTLDHWIMAACIALAVLIAAPSLLPDRARIAIAAWLLDGDKVHVFNAHVRENEDGSVTVYGPAQK